MAEKKTEEDAKKIKVVELKDKKVAVLRFAEGGIL
jgi:hypothetical protein